MPVRKVSNRGGNIIGRFPSIKMGRMIAFESLLERDFIYLLDYDVRIERFEEQPLTIEYSHDGQTLHYTPDFQIIETGRLMLVECKPERFVDTDDNRRKFAVAHEWCVAHDWEFRVVTEQQIRAGFRLQNIKRLTAYARLAVDASLQSRIETCLQAAPTTTLQALAQSIDPADPQYIITCLLHLAFHHQIDLLLDTTPLSGDMTLAWQPQLRGEVKWPDRMCRVSTPTTTSVVFLRGKATTPALADSAREIATMERIITYIEPRSGIIKLWLYL